MRKEQDRGRKGREKKGQNHIPHLNWEGGQGREERGTNQEEKEKIGGKEGKCWGMGEGRGKRKAKRKGRRMREQEDGPEDKAHFIYFPPNIIWLLSGRKQKLAERWQLCGLCNFTFLKGLFTSLLEMDLWMGWTSNSASLKRSPLKSRQAAFQERHFTHCQAWAAVRVSRTQALPPPPYSVASRRPRRTQRVCAV